MRLAQPLAVALAALAIAAPAAGEAPRVAKGLDLAPEDALAVVVIRNAADLSQKAAAVNDTLALEQPQLANALGTVKRMAGIRDGFRDDGVTLAVLPALPDPDSPKAENRPLMLLPVDDFKAFVAGYGGEATEAGTSRVRMPGGRTAYARAVGDHALLGRSRERVADYEPAEASDQYLDAVGELGAAALGRSDIGVLFHVAPHRARIKDMLEKAAERARKQMKNAPGPGAKAVQEAYHAGLRRAISQTRGLVAGVSLTKKAGAELEITAQFEPGSALARAVGQGGSAAAHLDRLPDDPWLAAGSFDAQGLDAANLLKRLEAIVPEAKRGPGWAVLEVAEPALRQVRGGAWAYYVPKGNTMMGGLLKGITLLDVEDAAAFRETNREVIEKLDEVVLPVRAGGDGGGRSIRFNTQYGADALQIEGTRVDRYQIQPVLPQSMMERSGPIMMMMGGTGQSGYVAVKDGRVIVTSAADTELIRRGLKAAGAEGGLGTTRAIERLRKAAMPRNALGTAYLNLGGVAELAEKMARMFMPNQAPGLNAPADLTPLGIGLGGAGDGASLRLHVPGDAVQFVKSAAQKVAAQLGGTGADRPPRQ